MKTLIAAIAVAGLLATPVAAQELQQSKLLAKPSNSPRTATVPSNRYSNPAQRVYSSDGQFVGADPDARIRLYMQFDDALTGAD
jgi:hypothetical protein